MMHAILLSLKVSTCCVLLLLVPGCALGWLLAKHEFRGKSIIISLTQVPMVIPPVATGYLLLLVFGANGILGRWLNEFFGVTLPFTWYGAVLAASVVSFPLMVRSIRLSIEQVDPRLEQAARTMGAGPLRTFFSVTLPLSYNGILAGCVLAFARSLGEFGATITFAGNLVDETQTLSLAAYNLMQSPGGDSGAMQLVVISIVLSILAVAGAEWLGRRRSCVGT